MDKKKILELDIDVESIIAKSSKLKSDLEQLRIEQDKLKKSGDSTSETFVKNAAQISKLSSEYNINQKQLANLITSNGSFLTIQDKANALLNKEVVSIKEAADSNKELKKIRDSLNLSVKEQADFAELLNEKINKNTDFIKENVSENEKLKIGIGDYKNAITGALQETGLFSGILEDMKSAFNVVSKILAPFKADILATAQNMRTSAAATEGMTVAQAGLTTATNIGTGAMRIFALAVASTGVGAIIIIIALLINYLSKLDPVVDKIEQVFAGFGGIIDLLTNKVGDFLSSITSVGDFFSKIGGILADPIGSFKSLGKEMAEAAKEAANLKERQQELADQLDINSILNKKQESEIARLMIQAKDRSKSAAEQNKAFADAEKLNAEIFERNKKTAEEGLDIAIIIAKKKKQLTEEEIQDLRNLDIARANSLLNDGKITIEAYDELKKAFEDKIDVENQYNEQLDKITTKSNNALEKQQAEAEARKAKELQKLKEYKDKKIQFLNEDLELFIATENLKDKKTLEQIDFILKVAKKRIEILDKEYAYGRISKLKYEAELLKITQDSETAQALRFTERKKAELDLFIENNVSKIDSTKTLTDFIISEEDNRLNAILQKKLIILEAEKETNQALIDAKIASNVELTNADLEYLTTKTNLENEFSNQKKENQTALEEELKNKKVIDIENELAQTGLDLDQQLALKIKALELQKQEDLKNAEKTGADKKLIEDKYAGITKAITKEVEFAKLGIIASGLSQAKGLFKENTLAYKAISVAEATINTYKAATAAYAAGSSVGGPLGLVLGPVMAGVAIASGLANVANIVGVKLAKGAIDLDGPGTTTSDSIPAQLSRGESVINAEATSNNKSLLQAINYNSGIDFAKQVYPSSVANIYNNNQSQQIDYDLLGAKIAESNMSLPAPIVYTKITEVEDELKGRAAIIEGANF
jgi:hypothetical protein